MVEIHEGNKRAGRKIAAIRLSCVMELSAQPESANANLSRSRRTVNPSASPPGEADVRHVPRQALTFHLLWRFGVVAPIVLLLGRDQSAGNGAQNDGVTLWHFHSIVCRHDFHPHGTRRLLAKAAIRLMGCRATHERRVCRRGDFTSGSAPRVA